MGLVRTRITLSNWREQALSPLEVDALVDTRATMLCIPEYVALQLHLGELYEREATTADGKKHLCSYGGPVQVTFQNRGCFVGALVIGDEVLLGAVPMEDMDLIVSPANRSVSVNPNSPNIPSVIVK